ncbi:MAG: hypothetical protein FWC19_10795 [Treponema sp.]|nr:hypothetical protein [Treponema sp.]
MKVVIITVPMKPPQEISKVQYPVDGNKSIFTVNGKSAVSYCMNKPIVFYFFIYPCLKSV